MKTHSQPLPMPPDPPSAAEIRCVMEDAGFFRQRRQRPRNPDAAGADREIFLDRAGFAALAGVEVAGLNRWLSGARTPPRGLWHLVAMIEAGEDLHGMPETKPSAEDIRAWLAERSLSQYRFAQLISEPLRKVQKWCAAGGAGPYWLWYAMRRLDEIGPAPAPEPVDEAPAP